MALNTNKLRQLMQAYNLSQRDLASMSGVDESTMSRYLNGTRQPKGETLANMATALYTTPNDLLGLKPPEETNEIVTLIARNASSIPDDVKIKLIKILIESSEKGE